MKRPTRHHWPDLIIAGLLVACSLAVYCATITPSLSYKSPDGNELATIPYILGLAHSTGYPLYTWLGKLFTLLPIGDVAHRVNLMSAVLGATGVGLLYWLICVLTQTETGHKVSPQSRLAAAFAALLFAFSRTFWSQTGIAEVYTPNLFMVALALLLLLMWARAEEQSRRSQSIDPGLWRRLIPSTRPLAFLFLSALALGLSLGTHMSSLGFAPAFGLFVLLVSWEAALSPITWAAGLAGFGLGALQFLWLPFKAASLNDPLMLRNAPDTIGGIYRYTLGAFPQLKFAFAWSQIPDRIVLYLAFLLQQFGLVGILLGLIGMWVALFRWPKRFALLIAMYLTHVIFFTQYAAFDLDVFFIPAHLIFAILIGIGLWQILTWLSGGVRRVVASVGLTGRPLAFFRAGLVAVATFALLLGLIRELGINWEHNDYSQDTAINDFYENVFALLPQNSTLLGRGGVFGYDMFYYQLVYDLRPDVTIPQLTTPQPRLAQTVERQLYTTDASNGRQRAAPWSIPADSLPQDAWLVPVLVAPTPQTHGIGGARSELTLWQISDTAPQLLIPTEDATPGHSTLAQLQGKTLIGFDLEPSSIQAGMAVHLRLYWILDNPKNLRVTLGMNSDRLIDYEIGFGNLSRYAQESNIQSAEDWVVVDDFWLVIPRTAGLGVQSLSVDDAVFRHPLGDDQVAKWHEFAKLEVEKAAPLLNWE